MLQERINRVINNHQMSCQHTNHYLYILKGFEPLLGRYTVPVEEFDADKIPSMKNFYITYENALELDPHVVERLKEYAYDLWIVDFNWFRDIYLTKSYNPHYVDHKVINQEDYVNYPDLDWVEKRKTISIFNTINSSIGFTDPPMPHEDTKRYREYLRNFNI